MNSKITWRRIQAFLFFTHGVTFQTGQAVPGWLARHTEDTKFNYALKRVSERAMKINDEVGRKIEDLERDHQATGEHLVLLYNPDKTRAYTAEGEKALRDAKIEVPDWEFEIEPHFCTEIPEDLEGPAREMLKGFVIAELHEVKTASG